MSKHTQNNLFNYIISNSEIDDIQSRFISYKLELAEVKYIKEIILKKEHHFTFYTDIGLFDIKTVNVPLPISLVIRK